MNKLKNIILNLIYNSIRISKKKNSVRFLGIISFLESIILPIPPDIFLIPAVLGNKKKWLYLSIYCTIFSILGGLLGYMIGYFLWDLVGNDIINFYKAQNKIEELKNQFDKYGWFIIFIAGFTPLPYKIFTIGSGLLSFNILMFVFCSFISRGLRFITLSYLVKKYGEKGINMVENHFTKISFIILFFSIIILYYLF